MTSTRILARCAAVALGLALALGSAVAHAHGASNGFVTFGLDTNGVRGELAVALRDLDAALRLDADGDGAIRWDELRASHAAIAHYVADRITVRVDDHACPLRVSEQLVDARDDGNYALVRMTGDCTGTAIAVDYQVLFETDRQHRGLVRLVTPDGAVTAGVAAPDAPRVAAVAASPTAVRDTILRFAAEGVHHIAIGYDHVLFLLCLVLPVVLGGRSDPWRSSAIADPSRVGAIAGPLVRVVTAFTAAHSITLALAVLGVLAPPARFTEPAIAATVICAALANLHGRGRSRVGWPLAFALGLVHGFGFASALTELALPTGSLVAALVGFNVGVEAGQLVIVLALVPLGLALRCRTQDGGRLVLRGASAGIAVIGVLWLGERLLEAGSVA